MVKKVHYCVECGESRMIDRDDYFNEIYREDDLVYCLCKAEGDIRRFVQDKDTVKSNE